PATTHPSPLSLHDALPIYLLSGQKADLEHRLASTGQMLADTRLTTSAEHSALAATKGALETRLAETERTLAEVRRNAAEEHGARSEEHTSELQSRFDLVCR